MKRPAGDPRGEELALEVGAGPPHADIAALSFGVRFPCFWRRFDWGLTGLWVVLVIFGSFEDQKVWGVEILEVGRVWRTVVKRVTYSASRRFVVTTGPYDHMLRNNS
jgi:hypothetical protein